MFRDGEVSGKVINSSGQGVQGITVYVANTATGNSSTATTGSDGTYALDGLPTGSYTVSFQPPTGQHYLYQWYPGKSDPQGSADASVTSGQVTTGINATLATGGTISGTAFGHGAPLAGATVYVEHGHWVVRELRHRLDPGHDRP